MVKLLAMPPRVEAHLQVQGPVPDPGEAGRAEPDPRGSDDISVWLNNARDELGGLAAQPSAHITPYVKLQAAVASRAHKESGSSARSRLWRALSLAYLAPRASPVGTD